MRARCEAGLPRHTGSRLLAALLICSLVPALVGWSNGSTGGDSFGTHDWILRQADRLAVAGGVSWLDRAVGEAATDDPDLVLHDTYHHVYDIWGSTYGDAPRRVQELYDETVQQLRDGDREGASRTFGLLSHYYSDVCQPLHTDQCPAEDAIHDRYELAAQRYTDDPGENDSWVVSDGLRQVPDAAGATEQAAVSSHASYDLLVGEFAAQGMDTRVLLITEQSLNRAANDLAGLMATAARDAQIPFGQSAPASSNPSDLTSQTPVAEGGLGATSAPSSQAAATAGVAPSSSAEATRGLASSTNGATPRTLLFWVVASAAFACALFGALGGLRPPS